jgi:hypothetical protein
MAKPPFLLPEPKSTSFGDKALDFVFGPIEAPNLYTSSRLYVTSNI